MPHSGHENDVTNPTDCGKRGVQLLEEIMKHIHAEQKHWDQCIWAEAVPTEKMYVESKFDEIQPPPTCGTAYCVAGWAAHLTGAKILWHPQFKYDMDENQYYVEFFTASHVKHKNGMVLKIEDYAKNVLDLDDYEAETLFLGGNTLDELDEKLEALKSGELI